MSRQAIHAKGRAMRAENERWWAAERQRRIEARRAVARQQVPIEGMSLIGMPSLNEMLDEVQPSATRAAGGSE